MHPSYNKYPQGVTRIWGIFFSPTWGRLNHFRSLEVKSFHKKQGFLHAKSQRSPRKNLRSSRLCKSLKVEANRQLKIEKQWLSELESYFYRQDFPTNFVYWF